MKKQDYLGSNPIDMKTQKGQKVVVTGGSRGLGLGIVEALVEQQAHVTVVVRDHERLAEVSKRLGVDVIRGDVTDEKLARSVLRDVRPSVLVLNSLLTIVFMTTLNSNSNAQNQAQSDIAVHPPVFTHAPGKSIEVNGKQIWVEQEGNGQPLILLPGGPAASHLTFHPYFTSLSDKYRVIYYDYYGRGKSGRPASYKEITFEQDVEDLEGLRKELKLEKINIYGFSYGGMVAQAYALKYPAHVNKLILANTLHSAEMWQRNHENINLEVSRQFPEIWGEIIAMKKIGINSFDPIMQEKFAVASQLVRFYNPDNAKKVLKEPGSFNMDLYEQFVGSDIDFFIGNEVAKLPDFRPRLKDLKMPVMIIAGRYDRALYPAYQLEFKTFCPQAEFHMMERSGNFAHIEEPEKLFQLIRKFLDRP